MEEKRHITTYLNSQSVHAYETMKMKPEQTTDEKKTIVDVGADCGCVKRKRKKKNDPRKVIRWLIIKSYFSFLFEFSMRLSKSSNKVVNISYFRSTPYSGNNKNNRCVLVRVG